MYINDQPAMPSGRQRQVQPIILHATSFSLILRVMARSQLRRPLGLLMLVKLFLPNNGLHIHNAKTLAAKLRVLGCDSPNSSVASNALRNRAAVTCDGTSSELISIMTAVRDIR